MTATVTQVVTHVQQDWPGPLDPDASLTACRGVASRWRERTLDPVTTSQWFFVQILHGNTACPHLRHLAKCHVTASAYGQARMRFPLTVFEQWLHAVSHALQPQPLDEGRWLEFFHARYPRTASAFGPARNTTPRVGVPRGAPVGAVACGYRAGLTNIGGPSAPP
jgi:hypothetical protein